MFYLFSEKYVHHPINAFHLMKRAVQYWPTIGLKNVSIPEKSDFIFGASFGLVSIQAYHDLEMFDMAKGIIKDPMQGRIWNACKNISSDELTIIASTAKKVWKYRIFSNIRPSVI